MIVLDAHIWIWWVDGNLKLLLENLQLIQSHQTSGLGISTISCWNEALVIKIDTAVRYTKKGGWVGNQFKEREVARAVRKEAAGYNINVDTLLELVKHQREYQ